MSHRRPITRLASVGSLIAFLSACSSDHTTAPASVITPDNALADKSEGRGVFQRYVAIGTSISMGWQSDGVFFVTQATSWPAQLAALGGRTLSQPYIAAP